MGRYAEVPAGSIPRRVHVTSFLRRQWHTLLTPRLHPGDSGGGYTLHHEWGRWTIRPVKGWRSRRWISVPLHTNRAVAKGDRDRALDWMARTLNL